MTDKKLTDTPTLAKDAMERLRRVAREKLATKSGRASIVRTLGALAGSAMPDVDFETAELGDSEEADAFREGVQTGKLTRLLGSMLIRPPTEETDNDDE